MYVDDACRAIALILDKGKPNEIYNIGPQGDVRTNREIATLIAHATGHSERLVYLTEYDRPDHDRRYEVDAGKTRALGWSPNRPLEQRLEETVSWYASHRDWWSSLLADAEKLYNDEAERTRV